MSGCLTFDTEGNAKFASVEEAESWWSSVESELIKEWQEEQAACARWASAVNSLRGLLAEEALRAQLLTETGHQHQIPANVWLSTDAEALLSNGYGRITSSDGVISTFSFEGIIVISRKAMEAFLDHEKPNRIEAYSPIDEQRHPYLALMIRAAHEIDFAHEDRVLKKTIEAWLQKNWPSDLGPATPAKISNMATFLRRPADETGGQSKPKGRTKKS